MWQTTNHDYTFYRVCFFIFERIALLTWQCTPLFLSGHSQKVLVRIFSQIVTKLKFSYLQHIASNKNVCVLHCKLVDLLLDRRFRLTIFHQYQCPIVFSVEWLRSVFHSVTESFHLFIEDILWVGGSDAVEFQGAASQRFHHFNRFRIPLFTMGARPRTATLAFEPRSCWPARRSTLALCLFAPGLGFLKANTAVLTRPRGARVFGAVSLLTQDARPQWHRILDWTLAKTWHPHKS